MKERITTGTNWSHFESTLDWNDGTKLSLVYYGNKKGGLEEVPTGYRFKNTAPPLSLATFLEKKCAAYPTSCIPVAIEDTQ